MELKIQFTLESESEPGSGFRVGAGVSVEDGVELGQRFRVRGNKG